jgi:phosphohistidine phosphatase
VKQLYIVRHARAVEPNGDDVKRGLMKSGGADAEKMSRRFKKLADVPDVLISSSAKRARQTAEIFAKAFGVKNRKIRQQSEVYEGGMSAIMGLLKELDAAISSAMIFGHVPSLNELADSLLKDFKDEIPTCGIVAIDLSIENWGELAGGVGSLVFFEHPKLKQQQREKSKAARQQLEASIGAAVDKELKKVDSKSAKKMQQSVQKASAKISKKFAKVLSKVREDVAKNAKKESASSGKAKTKSKIKSSKTKSEGK